MDERINWRHLGAYIFVTEPDPLKDFQDSVPRTWVLVVTSAAIVIGQAFVCGLDRFCTDRNFWPDILFGCSMDAITGFGSAIVACVLQFASLRRKFHPIIADVYAVFLAIVGMGCSMPAIIIGAGGPPE
ncbi:MAG: hypothetical protein ABSH22_14695 [Tepidisphaeraceae bacterium]